MKALVVAHDHLSAAGLVGDALSDAGYALDVRVVVPAERFDSPDVGLDLPSLVGYDLVVPLGAPWSVYDDARVGSWVHREIDYLAAADARGVPVFGICFGGQLLARTHGGQVRKAPAPEIGWVQVVGNGVVPHGPWFEWHFDQWVPPRDSEQLAANAHSPQAFALRRNLAVQFHPEITAAVLRGWLGNNGAEAARAHGIDPDELLAETEREEPAAAARAAALVAAVLDRIG